MTMKQEKGIKRKANTHEADIACLIGSILFPVVYSTTRQKMRSWCVYVVKQSGGARAEAKKYRFKM